MTAFTEFLALRVQELERERVALRRRVSTLERSRDHWRAQARRPRPVFTKLVVTSGPLQVPRGEAAYNWGPKRAA